MKKNLVLALGLAMMIAVVGCGQTTSEQPAEVSTETTTEAEAVEETDATEETAEDAEAEETEEAAEEETADDPAVKSEGVMTYAEYAAADLDTEVTVETYVQATQGWWEDKITVYTQDLDGAYFIYQLPCSEEDAALLVPGTKIRVTGYKSEWSGEVEIIDATYEILEGNYVAPATDVTALLATDEIADYQNQFVSFTGMTVEDAGNGEAFMYNWDGSGSQGDDLYFNVSVDGETYTFTVESYLCGADTDVYKAVEALQIGDTVDMEGFLYWYEGVNPHITSVTVK